MKESGSVAFFCTKLSLRIIAKEKPAKKRVSQTVDKAPSQEGAFLVS